MIWTKIITKIKLRSCCVLALAIVVHDGVPVVGVVGGCVLVLDVGCVHVLVKGVACGCVLVRQLGSFGEVVSGLFCRYSENEALVTDPAHQQAPP